MAASKTKAQKKREYSKVLCTIAFIAFLLLGTWMVYRYYSLVQLAIASGSDALPDASLPIAGITFIFAPIMSYLTYQAGLKNSRNKYGIDANGQPYVEKAGGD